jgi:hypothetical protein
VLFKICSVSRRDLNIAWIDYGKAFDSVPHRWIKIDNEEAFKFCRLLVEKQSTQIQRKANKGLMQTRAIYIKRGIFQGHSFSPLFCITLIKQIQTWVPSIWN